MGVHTRTFVSVADCVAANCDGRKAVFVGAKAAAEETVNRRAADENFMVLLIVVKVFDQQRSFDANEANDASTQTHFR